MIEDPTEAERRALDLLRQHDPALTLRPGSAARVQARLDRPAKKRRYAGPVVLAAVVLSTASFAARALFFPSQVSPEVLAAIHPSLAVEVDPVVEAVPVEQVAPVVEADPVGQAADVGLAADVAKADPVRTVAPVVQVPSPPVASPASRGSALLDEARLLERVAQQLKNQQIKQALAGVEAYEKKYPSGELRLEAVGFRVQAFELTGVENVTAAMAGQWVAALSALGRCADAVRLARQPAHREAFTRGLKGFCPP
jgi:hypothetical protein